MYQDGRTDGSFSIIFPSLLNSRAIKMVERVAATASAIGPAKTIPSIPKKIGIIKRSGIRNKICRVNVTNMPILALAVEAK